MLFHSAWLDVTGARRQSARRYLPTTVGGITPGPILHECF